LLSRGSVQKKVLDGILGMSIVAAVPNPRQERTSLEAHAANVTVEMLTDIQRHIEERMMVTDLFTNVNISWNTNSVWVRLKSLR
jgi:hypothetical protein